jgi:hypothetical protein
MQILVFLLVITTTLAASPLSASDSSAWTALKEGRAVLMLRHALAPGTGDPAGFVLGDCGTQRNLNDTGREQARAWKAFLAEHGIVEARVVPGR